MTGGDLKNRSLLMDIRKVVLRQTWKHKNSLILSLDLTDLKRIRSLLRTKSISDDEAKLSRFIYLYRMSGGILGAFQNASSSA